MTLGSALILIAALLAAVAIVTAFGWAGGRARWEKTFRLAYHGMTGTLVLASILLMAAILRHDFRYEYVIDYSSRDLPLLYLISAFWGGQEGTYLLWALLGALLGYALFRKHAWQPAAVMSAYTPTIAVLLVFMLNPQGNPFRLAPMTPPDGRGLNPLLQDPWMAIHPPIVFLGYAAMTIPAVLAWVAVFRRDEKGWLGPALRWSLIGFVTLGIGIILGGIWAYKVLGWGGFWGWDPVENASLIPWIVGAALIHGLLVQQAIGALRRTNLILAMAAYLLVMYSTFLTRSGVLANFSVHSFPKGTIYGWLVAALLAVTAVSLLAQLRRRAAEGAPLDTRLAWPLILTTTIVLFAVSAILVLVGTSWPLLSSMMGAPATPKAPFYNSVNLPVYLILLAVLGLGPFLAWIPLPAKLWLRRFVPALLLAALFTALAAVFGGRGGKPLVLFFVAALALSSNVIRLIEVARRRWLLTGAALAHIGFALIFLGIVASESWDQSQDVNLTTGESATVFGHTLTYHGHINGSEPKDRWGLTIMDANGRREEASVTFYQLPDGELFKKPSILRTFTHDIYLAPNQVELERAGGDTLQLTKDTPVSLDKATLTFLRFAHGGDMSGEMVINALVMVEANGSPADTISLPLRAGAEGMQGTPVPVAALGGASLTMVGMAVEQGTIEVTSDSQAAAPGAGSSRLTLQASIKPMINLLWIGTAFLALGCIVALTRRLVDQRMLAARPGGPRAAG